jgi:hypothetical protein
MEYNPTTAPTPYNLKFRVSDRQELSVVNIVFQIDNTNVVN